MFYFQKFILAVLFVVKSCNFSMLLLKVHTIIIHIPNFVFWKKLLKFLKILQNLVRPRNHLHLLQKWLSLFEKFIPAVLFIVKSCNFTIINCKVYTSILNSKKMVLFNKVVKFFDFFPKCCPFAYSRCTIFSTINTKCN